MKTHERLNKAISFLKGEGIVRTSQQVAEKMKIDKGNLSKALNGNTRYLTKGFISRFNHAFGGIFSKQWLESGEGDFLVSETYCKFREQNMEGIPYYNVSFADFDNAEKEMSFESKIHCTRFNTATLWCNMTGESMSPLIQHGDIIAMRKLADAQYLVDGEVYGVSLPNGVNIIRKICKSKKPGILILVPCNESVGKQEIPASSVEEIYQVMGLMRNI